MKKTHREEIDDLLKKSKYIRTYFYEEKEKYPDIVHIYMEAEGHLAIAETMKIVVGVGDMNLNYMVSIYSWTDIDGYLDEINEIKNKSIKNETTERI